MSESDLPSLWTHEPHTHLEFRPGDKVADIDTNATPGFRGKKADAPALQAERNERFAELQEMLYANSRSGDTRSILLVLQGMDTAGKGGIVKHVVGGGNPQGIRYMSFGKPTDGRVVAPLSVAHPQGAADRRPYRGFRPQPLRGRVDRAGAQLGGTGRVGGALRRDQRLREGARRRRHDADQGGDVRLARRAEGTAGRTPRPSGQVLEVQPRQTSTNGSSGRCTRRPTRRCWTRRRPTTRHGTSIPCDRKWYSRLAITELLIEALEELDLSWPPADFDIEAEKKRLAEA